MLLFHWITFCKLKCFIDIVISSRFFCPRPPLLLSNQNRHATQATDVSTTCAVVIFRVKVSCITSVDGIMLWLLIWLSDFCHLLCLTSVIKMRKMTKLRQKLQISHFDVIRALRFFLLKRNITFSDLFKSTSLEYLASTSCIKCFLEFLYKFHSNRKWILFSTLLIRQAKLAHSNILRKR